MKLSILITGQIRDNMVFQSVTNSVEAASSCFNKIIYCAWNDQVEKAKSLLSPGSPITCVGASYLLPIGTDADSSTVSFFAQLQQFSHALAEIPADNFVIRIRADNSNIDEHGLRYLAALINVANEHHDLNVKSIVLGASDWVPFFFDDRTMLISPKLQNTIKSIKISDLYRIDQRNIFPEFMFYSSILSLSEANRDLREFYAFDHRLRHYENCVQSVLHAISIFGENGYRKGSEAYVGVIQRNFLFITDLLHEFITSGILTSPPTGMMHHLCSGFSVYTMDRVVASFNRNADDYSRDYQNVMSAVGSGHDHIFKLSDKATALDAKAYLNIIRRAVGERNKIWTEDFPNRLAQASIAPIIQFYRASSLIKSGDHKASLDLMRANVEIGYSTDIQLGLIKEAEDALSALECN